MLKTAIPIGEASLPCTLAGKTDNRIARKDVMRERGVQALLMRQPAGLPAVIAAHQRAPPIHRFWTCLIVPVRRLMLLTERVLFVLFRYGRQTVPQPHNLVGCRFKLGFRPSGLLALDLP